MGALTATLYALAVILPGLTQDLNNKTFSKDFMFGAATAAYQVEGGWDADGKGENIWDQLAHAHPESIKDGANGDIACDSYNKYTEDVNLLKELGVNHYRFSLSWSRILPNGLSNKINEAGVNYYKNLIRELKNNNIEPLVTMYHWDLPQSLQEEGGWPNDLIINWFADYARVCFEQFGESVTYWMTFNEPKQICQEGYGNANLAPVIHSPGIGDYLCAHNLLRAHAKVWHIYDEEFRATQKGKIGIVIDSHWYQPTDSNSTKDEVAAETMRMFAFGMYAHPLFTGDYPSIMKENIARRSKLQGFASSRLPEFTDEERAYLNGTVDILGVNSYSASEAEHIDNPDPDTAGWEADSEVKAFQSDDWPPSASSWLKVTPWATRELVKWIAKTYGNPPMIVTENGYSQNDTNLEDDVRINYIQEYLSNIKDAIDNDGVNLIGYTVWSLLDNLEWRNGFTEKFGLYAVDFNSLNRTRTPRQSVEFYKKLIKTRCLVDTCAE